MARAPSTGVYLLSFLDDPARSSYLFLRHATRPQLALHTGMAAGVRKSVCVARLSGVFKPTYTNLGAPAWLARIDATAEPALGSGPGF